MNISEAINTHGISIVLRSIFPNLNGLDFNKVKYNSDFDKSGFTNQNEFQDWSFAVG